MNNDCVEKGKSETRFSLLEVAIDSLTTAAQVQEAMEIEGVSKTRRQKLKQRLRHLQVRVSSPLVTLTQSN